MPVASSSSPAIVSSVATPSAASSVAASTVASRPLWGGMAAPDPGFPTAGLLLMLALLAVAGWAWWHGSRQRGLDLRSFWRLAGADPAGPARLGARPGAELPRVLWATRLDPTTRLAVVRWNGHELLVASTAGAAPVVLERRPVEKPEAPA